MDYADKIMIEKDMVFANEILRGVIGSTAHGTAIDGQEDRDEMGVYIESAEFVCGLTPLDHLIYRDKPEGVRSEPRDLDLTLYSYAGKVAQKMTRRRQNTIQVDVVEPLSHFRDAAREFLVMMQVPGYVRSCFLADVRSRCDHR